MFIHREYKNIILLSEHKIFFSHSTIKKNKYVNYCLFE
jgi:hypothetical protein